MRNNELPRVLHAESGILDPAMIERIRWRCRRGMLELDILLERFVDRHYAHLDDAQRRQFDALLDMPDNSLWDMITGRLHVPQGEQQALLEKLQAA